MTRGTLLLVDDDTRFRERLGRALEKRGYDVCCAENGQRALRLAQLGSPERAIVDLRMPGEWGLHLVRELLAIDPNTQVLVLTAYGSIATALEAIRLGAASYLQKPVSVDEIEVAFEKAEAPTAGVDPAAVEPVPSEVPSLARAEWEHINRVLTECGGNIRRAAQLLGLHRRTLQRKLAKFPVTR